MMTTQTKAPTVTPAMRTTSRPSSLLLLLSTLQSKLASLELKHLPISSEVASFSNTSSSSGLAVLGAVEVVVVTVGASVGAGVVVEGVVAVVVVVVAVVVVVSDSCSICPDSRSDVALVSTYATS